MPLLPVVFGSDETLHREVAVSLAGKGKARRESGKEDTIDMKVSVSPHVFDLFFGPLVEGDGTHLRDVDAEIPVDTRAPDADEDAQVDARPPRASGAAVSAVVVAGHGEEFLELGTELFLLLCGVVRLFVAHARVVL